MIIRLAGSFISIIRLLITDEPKDYDGSVNCWRIWKMRKRISYYTIAAAKGGDGEAMASILLHYDDYINYYSRREVVEKKGHGG